MARSGDGRPDFSPVRGRHLLIALSGGADSVALTCLLADARRDCALTLTAAHLDHGIRPESADDARWCAELCERLRIPLHTLRVDVPALAQRQGVGLETAARQARYDFLHTVKQAVGADFIALAHHMDDQAETVLMHLSRGAGLGGAGGMAEFSGALYRPLLGLRKAELEDYLTRIGQPWREDATNAVSDTPRNALRLNVLPALERAYPQAVPALNRYAETARLEDDYLAKQTEVYLSEHSRQLPFGRCLHLEGGLHEAILHRAIRALAEEELSWQQVNAIAALAKTDRGRFDYSDAHFAERGRFGIYFMQTSVAFPAPVPLNLSCEAILREICAVTARPGAAVPIRDHPLRQALRPEALQGAVLRTRQPGDRFRPLGCGDKLLSDYLIDRKIDRPLRDGIGLVARGNRVLWVCGLGISQEASLREGDEHAVILNCQYLYDFNQ